MTLADVEFNIRGELEEQEDILRCLRNLLMTPAGTVPLDREFGLDTSFLGAPMDVARSMMAVEIIVKVMKYEPRVNVLEVDMEADADGKLTTKVVITSA